MNDVDSDGLLQENLALNEQVKLLVRTEQRLNQARRSLAAQLKRVEALEQLARGLGRRKSSSEILDLMVATLSENLAVDQAVAFTVQADALVPASFRTVQGWEPASVDFASSALPVGAIPSVREIVLLEDRNAATELSPVLDAVGAAVGGHAFLEVVAPLHGSNGQLVALVVLRKIDRAVSFHEAAPNESDRPFLELATAHAEAALQNLLLTDELRAFASALEKKVDDRTAALARANEELAESLHQIQDAQEQLLRAGKMAAVGNLAAGLSHELNNPLGIVLGYVQLLLRSESADPSAQRRLAIVERQVQRCRKLVATLLDLSETTPGAPREASGAELLSALLEQAGGEATAREVTLVAEPVAPNLPPLFLDLEELGSALLSIVVNAIEATPRAGAVWLTLREETRDGTGGVVLSVRDAGSGIPPDVLPRIFDPFFSTKPVGEKSGLGLSLARQVIDAHGGCVDVESTVDIGTTFRVWLPAARRHAAKTARAVARA